MTAARSKPCDPDAYGVPRRSREYLEHLAAGNPPESGEDLERRDVRLLRALRHFDGARLSDLLDALDLDDGPATRKNLHHHLGKLIDLGLVVWSGSYTHRIYRLARKP